MAGADSRDFRPIFPYFCKMQTTLDHIYELISEAEVDKALKKLQGALSMAKSEMVNDVLLLSAQYKKLQSDLRKGILDYNQESLATNRIINGLLSLVDELKETPEIFAQFSQMEWEMDQTMMTKKRVELPEDTKDALFLRMAYVREKKLRARALWVDGSPGGNNFEWGMLVSLGVEFDRASTSGEAFEMLQKTDYDFIISDIDRDGNPAEGLDFLKSLPETKKRIPFIFYIGAVNKDRGVPPHAFGITDMPSELAHLALDVLERKF